MFSLFYRFVFSRLAAIVFYMSRITVAQIKFAVLRDQRQVGKQLAVDFGYKRSDMKQYFVGRTYFYSLVNGEQGAVRLKVNEHHLSCFRIEAFDVVECEQILFGNDRTVDGSCTNCIQFGLDACFFRLCFLVTTATYARKRKSENG